MTDRDALPTDREVRAAVDHLLMQAAAGDARPTATALAARLGVSRPALYRHFRSAVDELLTAASTHEATRRRRIRDRDSEIAKLRREKAELRRHVEVYEEIIRQLTSENEQLKRQLEKQAGVTQIGKPRPT
jgi:AcrR family transcriptional regulator